MLCINKCLPFQQYVKCTVVSSCTALLSPPRASSSSLSISSSRLSILASCLVLCRLWWSCMRVDSSDLLLRRRCPRPLPPLPPTLAPRGRGEGGGGPSAPGRSPGVQKSTLLRSVPGARRTGSRGKILYRTLHSRHVS